MSTQPDEWVLVPRAMHVDMISAFWRVKNGFHFHDEPPPSDRSDLAAYEAMIAARPTPLGDGGVVWMAAQYLLARGATKGSVAFEHEGRHISLVAQYIDGEDA